MHYHSLPYSASYFVVPFCTLYLGADPHCVNIYAGMGTSGQDPSLLKWKHTSCTTISFWPNWLHGTYCHLLGSIRPCPQSTDCAVESEPWFLDSHLLPKWDIVSMPHGFLIFPVGSEDVKHACIMSAWKQVSPPPPPPPTPYTHIHTLQCGQQQAHHLESDLSLPRSSLVLLLSTQHRHGGNLLHCWLVPLQLQQSLELENVSSHKCPAYPFIDISFPITAGK